MVRKALLLSGVFLLIVTLAAVLLWINVNRMLQPVDAAAVDDIVLVTIEAGSGTTQIAAALFEKGLIRNPTMFRLYARWHKLDTAFIAGTYRLSPSMSVEQIASVITGGEVHRDTQWFTIPEGFTVDQIADRLSRMGLADRERFLELAKNPPDSLMRRFPVLNEIDYQAIQNITGQGWQRNHTPLILEGYLFPDTYEIEAGATEEEIIYLMLGRLMAVYEDEYEREQINDGRIASMSMHQVLTLASIVEKEAGHRDDFKLIAGVFHNRLAVNHALESCATVNFFLDIPIEVLSSAQRDIYSPYNTYLDTGLPPGPIASPGKRAIQAVLYPAKTEYFWFCAKGDGSGRSLFARTHAEHMQNVAIAEENRRNRN